MGLVLAFGNDVDAYYERLLSGESAITLIDRFDASKFPTRFGGQIRGFTAEGYIDGKNDQRLDDYLRYCIVAGKRALECADLGGDKLNKSDAQIQSTPEKRWATPMFGTRIPKHMVPDLGPDRKLAVIAVFCYRCALSFRIPLRSSCFEAAGQFPFEASPKQLSSTLHELRGLNLTGTLPVEFVNLTYLREIWHVLISKPAGEELDIPYSLRTIEETPLDQDLETERVFYNYFSIGMDAQVAYGFHNLRNEKPYLAQTRLIYSGYSCKQGWFFTPCSSDPGLRSLKNILRIYAKKVNSSKWEQVPVPSRVYVN
ncbi:hypothetical protein CASFOL_035695 [Castilleja foliolosa]|uniref:beta-ketoacyl-[acyl-carrier-protein] synthase I n=1 Tax=Castilleja foliolosa TaxID=1961234 RepID=A0ABD3BTK1_9LAMI